MEYITNIESPVGILTVSSDGENILGLWLEGQKYFARTLGKCVVEQNLPLFESVRIWLDSYFSGKVPDFMPPLKPQGSAFQQSIWAILSKIPYGKTVSYGEIARKYNAKNPEKHTSARAVGGAVGHNPISILIPCHRVLGAGGNLTGYAGGVDKKIQLLQVEGSLEMCNNDKK
jgi:methylated-DNA-[protein]-cysteine S-methyltransferase